MFVRDERVKHDKTCQMTGLRRNVIDAFEATGDQFAAVRTRSEVGDSIGKRSAVNAVR
jgi:hypothetical protein